MAGTYMDAGQSPHIVVNCCAVQICVMEMLYCLCFVFISYKLLLQSCSSCAVVLDVSNNLKATALNSRMYAAELMTSWEQTVCILYILVSF
jgi:hypothetical protein